MSANSPTEQPPPALRRSAWRMRVAALALLVSIATVTVTVVVMLMRIPPPTPAARRHPATAATQVRPLTPSYAPHGVGPCDTVDPPYTTATPEYWEWNHGAHAVHVPWRRRDPSRLRCQRQFLGSA